jgi:N-acyl-D-aspartate/D-glutamate deacylase
MSWTEDCFEPPHPTRKRSDRPANDFTNVCVIFQCRMKTRLLLSIASLAVLSGCGPREDSPKKALTGATLVDGTGVAAIPSSVILIDHGIITATGPASTQIPDGFEKVNVGGKFIVPGLIDAHVLPNADLQAFLLAGVTSVGLDAKIESSGPHVFPSLGKQAGIADQVIASNGSSPTETLAKIERMAKAEIPTLQIIQAATKNGGAWLEQTNLGSIKAGQRADLLVLNADPVADIKNLRQIYRIMRDGRWVDTGNGK